jgi:hypothetical protein
MRRRNPLTFDNRVEMTPELREAIRTRKDRALASMLSPAKHRSIEEATINSPHNFRVILVKDYDDITSSTERDANSITLYTSAEDYLSLNPIGPKKSDRLGLFTAFTYLHRFADNITGYIFSAFRVGPPPTKETTYLVISIHGGVYSQDMSEKARLRLAEANERLVACHEAFMEAASALGSPKAYASMIMYYVETHINSKMVREGYSRDVSQGMADLFPLCEFTPASRPLFLPVDTARMPRVKEFTPEKIAVCNIYGEKMNVLFREFYNTFIPALYGSVWNI